MFVGSILFVSVFRQERRRTREWFIEPPVVLVELRRGEARPPQLIANARVQ